MTETQNSAAAEIELQVMWNRLQSVVDEQAQALMHTAFSPIVRESGDISAGVFDVQGRMLAQAVTGTPGHINTMAESVKYFTEYFPPETMAEGDTYLTNDPWLGSGHLNDFVLVQPSFLDGKLVGMVSCTSHLVDLGGLGMGPDGSDVYDEGLLIPPIKLVDAGAMNETLLALIKSNSRAPFQNEGDVYALIACCDVASARLAAMMKELEITSLDRVGAYIFDTSRRITEAAIAEVPDGTYTYTMRVDGYDFEIDMVATMTVEGSKLKVDFGGSSPCSRYGINVPLNYATAYSVFGLRCIFAPEVPNNAGSLGCFEITAPEEGCILNAPRPAPVAQRHILGQIMPDLMYGCLHQAIPDRIPAEGSSCMYDLPLRGGFEMNKGQGATKYAVEVTHNGGTGARPGKDGLSVAAFPSGVYGAQVEITESVAPLLFRRRELRADSGGAGKYRGGLGQNIELESRENQPITLFATVDRVKFPALGRDGGLSGAPGVLRLMHAEQMLNGKGKQEIPAGEVFDFRTPGGGGLGDPKERPAELVAEDVRLGLVSREAAQRDYGVALTPGGEVDAQATQSLRG
ncbi:hydantoinase B/oxoprolinase family protein [Leisingera sp. ANG-M1]|uniref:hydantoinase B/oxoprolinase family protein n=1 Tax=Leisingera sp. ANG-M1 TaxID=1577895 RepID=UPI00068AC004|nr:hydantoinase B/oxoprolinase family protein [Leisingera sp. ANG-M1]